MEISLSLLLRLVFAHFLSDFILQTDRICLGKKGKDKKSKKLSLTSKYKYQLLHSLTHAVVSYLVVAQWDLWMIFPLIFITHFLMDYVKSAYMKDGISSFVFDQFVHLTIISLLWMFLTDQYQTVFDFIRDKLSSDRFWIILTAYLLILRPTSIFLGLFIQRWTPTDLSSESLPHAGKWIGYLERILILTFILAGHLEGVGFLLAAKSIFRFGELNKAKEIKITEYVLIGTLTSFSIAIITGLLIKSISIF